MSKELNLNSGKGDKKEGVNPSSPEDAMSVAVSSLVNIAAYISEICETLKDIQPILYDMREYKKKELLHKDAITQFEIEEIEKDEGEDDEITGS